MVNMRTKTLIMLLLTTILFEPAAELRAAPSNGTRLPPKGGVELGYEYNTIFKRRLARSYGDLTSQNHFYTASFGAFDWLSLDGKIGVGDVTQEGASALPTLEYNTGFAGGYGFRIEVFEERRYGVRLLAGFQHISVHPQDRSADDDKYESFLDDWQGSALVAKDFKFLTVYAGLKGSDCEIVYKVNKHDKSRRFSENHIGFLSGLELYLFGNKAHLSVEGRFFDETALSTSVSYLF